MTTEPENTDPPSAPGGAVVTGVAQPPGFALAQALAARGYSVHVTDLDGRLATRAAAELGPSAFGSALDVRSVAACRAAVARTRRRWGSLEVWVNNAAVLRTGPAWDLDERTRQRMVEVNVVGAINGTLAALELMRSQGSGHVVNLVALGGLLPAAGQALDSGSTQAMVAFSLGALADLEEAGLSAVHISCLSADRNRLSDGQNPEQAFTAPAQAPELAQGLYRLLDEPRPMLAVPPWRGSVLRAAYLWPSLRPLGRTALPRTGSGRRRGRRPQR